MKAYLHEAQSDPLSVFVADLPFAAGCEVVMQLYHTTAVTWLWVGPDWAGPLLVGLAVVFLVLLASPPKA